MTLNEIYVLRNFSFLRTGTIVTSHEQEYITKARRVLNNDDDDDADDR